MAGSSGLQVPVDTTYRELKHKNQLNIPYHSIKKNHFLIFDLAEEYLPADQLFVIWRLLSSWLFHCPFQLFLLPAKTEENLLILKPHCNGTQFT